MATGMKVWTGVLVVSLALISIQWLPPEILPYGERPIVSHEELRSRALNAEVWSTNRVLQRIRWVSELEAYALENERDGVVVRGAGRQSEEALDGLHTALIRRLESLPRAEPGALYGFFFMPIDHAGHPDVQIPSNRSHLEFYIDEADGRPYCFAVRPQATSHTDDGDIRFQRTMLNPWENSRYRSGVGPCRFVVSYGLPGDRVMAWLERGALSFGIGERDPSGTDFRYWRPRRGAFGTYYYSLGDQQLKVDQCLGGMAEACVDLFLNPTIEASERVGADDRRLLAESPVRGFERSTEFGPAALVLFSDLEIEFGTEAFQRFWTSELDVEAAFEDAFDRDLGEWLVEWVDEEMSGYRPGPGLTQTARFGGLLTMMLFGLLVGVRNRKRKVA